ncbi:MAG: hypothetical protein RQ824_10345 [bacterium]|nr:hypothetical protein [bacterium]
MQRRSLSTYIGIYLVSTAGLTYEISLTRLFSLMQGYHFAFMVISIALIGISAGGALLMPVPWSKKFHAERFHATLAGLFSISSLLCFIAANHLLFDPVRAAWSKAEFLKILMQYIFLSAPFICAGMIISSAMKSMPDRIHRIYLFDLAGAATGCILVLLLLNYAGGEGAIIISSFLALAASLVFHLPGGIRSMIIPFIAFTLLISIILIPGRLMEPKISPYMSLSSALNFPGGRIIETINSPSGRLDIIDSPAVRSAPGISLGYTKSLPPQIGFTINGGGLRTVTSNKGDLSFLRHLPMSLPFSIIDRGDSFIVDAGGGMGLLLAMELGNGPVSGSETRGVIMDAMNGSLAPFSGSLYESTGIRHGAGRHVLKEMDRSFDTIHIQLTDTLGSSSSGIGGLQESYDLTSEAFTEYLDHLNDGGLISASIYLLPPPRGELKLLSTIVATLERVSSLEAGKSIAAIRSWGVATILVKKGFFNDDEVLRIKHFCKKKGFDLIWYPGMKREEANIYNRFETPVYQDLFRRIIEKEGRETFLDEYLFNLSPATDDSPFFWQTFKMSRMRETYETAGAKWGILIEGGYLLPIVFIQALIASLILIITPLLISKERRSPFGALIPTSIYFAAIGIGFMFLEITLMQKLIPALGEPVYALSAVLFSILISSGLGSYISGRYRLIRGNVSGLLIFLPLLILLYGFAVGWVVEAISSPPLLIRFALTFLFLLPLGMMMGIPFPTGMTLLGERDEGLIPWAWCVNGSFSVVSSILAMMIAIGFGYSTVLFLAACSYAIAWAAFMRLRKIR